MSGFEGTERKMMAGDEEDYEYDLGEEDDEEMDLGEDASEGGSLAAASSSSSAVGKPDFPAISAAAAAGDKAEYRRIRCPPHRLTPLRNQWDNVMSPIVEFLKLQIRFNQKNRSVELKTAEATEDPGAIQKGQDFIEAFMMGFEVQDAVALLRLDDLYIDSFMVTDVKMLAGDHLSRAIGRVAGQDGKTKYAIENATRTRIIVADQKIHIMGSFANIKLARDAICNLIIGAPPGKVYNQMRNVAKRLNERF